jgi:4'-phosphopantetheinyl transferase
VPGRRWAASRWALRAALAGYLGVDPVAVALRAGRRGKPALAGDSPLRFSLSHSGALALIAVASGREVGVDVERIGLRPAAFYDEWTSREAAAKCFGGGLGEPLPPRPLRVAPLDAGVGWAAALATEGEDEPQVRLRELGPAPAGAATAAAGRR